ncbi:MAG TPA: T9SS type A sorting domain-containing protein [Bacteroidales bacterium]
MKKTLVTFCLFIGSCLFILGQSPSYYIKYDYDAAGNRITRKCLSVTLRSATAPIDSSEVEGGLNELKVTIYPNPTKGVIVAGLSTFNPKASISYILYTADGKKIQQLNAESDRTPIDLSNYTPGIYLLKVVADKKNLEFKIIKQ